jgi:hypothetical protein
MPWFVCQTCGDTIKKVRVLFGNSPPPPTGRRPTWPKNPHSLVPSPPPTQLKQQPKLQAHGYSCSAGAGYDCVDCGRHFDAVSVKVRGRERKRERESGHPHFSIPSHPHPLNHHSHSPSQNTTHQSHNSCVTEHDKYAKGATKPGGFAAKGFYGDGEGAGGGGAGPPTTPADAPPPVGLEFLATRPPWACSACGVTCTSRETLLGHAAGVKHRRRANAAAKAAAGGGGGQEEKETAQPAEQAAAPPAPPATPAPPTKAPATAKSKPPKWKKLGVAALAAAPKRRLKVAALTAAVLAAAGLDAGDASSASAALAAWSGSSKFVVAKGRVSLAAGGDGA